MKIKKLDAKINDGLVLFPRSFIIPAESMSKESNPISISRYISLCRIDHKGWIIFSPDGSLNITGISVRYRDILRMYFIMLMPFLSYLESKIA